MVDSVLPFLSIAGQQASGGIVSGDERLVLLERRTESLAQGLEQVEEQLYRSNAQPGVSRGIAAMFATLTVASHVYHLIPVAIALALALAVGGMATSIAVRWEARGVAALGIVGCLLAPVLVGADHDLGSMAFMLVAGAAASA